MSERGKGAGEGSAAGRRGAAGKTRVSWREADEAARLAAPAELTPALLAWDAAAGDWAAAVRAGADPARQVTDRAMAGVIRQVPPGPVLDAGCGEGWLARELSTLGMDVTAIDGAPRMVALAAEACERADYRWVSFAEAADEPRRLGGAFGTVIFNFSLLDERITPVLEAAGSVLFPYGRILIQAAHPLSTDGDAGYRDGWRLMDEAAPGVPMRPPVPWYFRTFSTWILELRRAGLILIETYEPLDPVTGRPISLLLHATIPERRRDAARSGARRR